MTAANRPGRAGRLTASLVAAIASSCASPSGLTPVENGLVIQWLVCIDCAAQLDSLRALAAEKPVATVDSLNIALVNGPTGITIASVDSVFVISYVRDSTYRVKHLQPPMALTRTAYVTSNRERYENGYRSRGATGLGWIHDARAVADLNAALTLPLAPGVHAAVLYARDSLPPP